MQAVDTNYLYKYTTISMTNIHSVIFHRAEVDRDSFINGLIDGFMSVAILAIRFQIVPLVVTPVLGNGSRSAKLPLLIEKMLLSKNVPSVVTKRQKIGPNSF